jgi:Ca2+-binding RTX toxin-like protein
MHGRHLVRRTALVPAVTAGLLGASFLSPPGAQAAGEASCTIISPQVVLMYVNHPAVVPLLELSFGSGSAIVSINGSPVGSCALSGRTEVQVSSASGFGAWQVSDAGPFLNDAMQPSHFTFGENDPVVVVHGNPMTSASYQASGGTGVDIDGLPGPEINAATVYRELVLVGSDNNDTIDLAPNPMLVFDGTNTTIKGQGGNDTLRGGLHGEVIEGGSGNDQIEGWDGSDTLVPDGDADQVWGRASNGGPDTDDGAVDTFVVDFDGAEDTVRGDGFDAIDALSPLGVAFSNGGSHDDGSFQEGDTYSGIYDVTTGPGPDAIQTTGVGVVDAGDGNDTVLVGVSPINGVHADAGAGTDTLDLGEVAGPTDGSLSASGGGFVVPTFPQNLASHFEAMAGGSGPDTWTIDCACTATPRGGADDITFTRDGGRYVAEPTTDGADAVVAEDGVTVTADYAQRSAPVSLTLDAEADDGATGEGDALDGITTLLGGSAADTLVGDSRANRIEGGAGNDTVNGRGGDDTLLGDDGADALTGGSGADQLLGGVGSDRLAGGDGDDRLLGDAATAPTGGNDTLDGGAGDDDLFGHAGNDVFTEGSVANGQDLLSGGPGTDLASYALRGAAVRLSLNGRYDDGATGEGDRINGDVENLTGGKGADTITGNALANLLTGGPGSDVLSGLAGNDTFQSLDRLVDSLLGGTGVDRAHRDTTDKVNSVEQRF